ncbi:MAG: ribosome-associated translation inhibitor RaiA [Candidatus Koribacter versatilis]|uniref:Ribosome hibernation promoting factor n=1 Tax=Candidatus Korobacter versatilis TaxID=658062 RepID=A0A932A9Q5_9BACT|nr:ribosome-associated translation inhibitor RaiA [Candidatus Koribacter versatilis]
MRVEFTGRQYEITPTVRKHVEQSLNKLEKILGTTFDSHVILAAEKHRHIAEITITVRNHPIVGIAETAEMMAAIGEALDRIERQAVKYKGRMRAKKRGARNKRWAEPAAEAPVTQVAVGSNASTAVPVVVHGYPAVVRMTEAHVVKSDDSVALRPLTLEEAIKECEFRDREVFVFRDREGRVKVLHRTKDGKMELIEAP